MRDMSGDLDGIWPFAFNSISQRCGQLSFYLSAQPGMMDNVPVSDRTGLTVAYNLRLEFRLPEPLSAEDLPGAFTAALRDQLGLELKRAKVPTEVFVVDHVSTAIVKAP